MRFRQTVAATALGGLAALAGAAEPVAVLPVAPYVPAAPASPASGHWSVLVQDITLARTLERWGAQAGYRVKWDAQRNFLIGAPDSVEARSRPR